MPWKDKTVEELLNIKCVYNPLAQLFTILLLTREAGPYRA